MVTRLITEPKLGTTSADEPGWPDELGVNRQDTRDDRCWRLIGRYALKGLTEPEATRDQLAGGQRI